MKRSFVVLFFIAVVGLSPMLAGCSGSDVCSCGAGEICEDGKCVPDPDYCQSNVDCPTGKICNVENHRCESVMPDLSDGDEMDSIQNDGDEEDLTVDLPDDETNEDVEGELPDGMELEDVSDLPIDGDIEEIEGDTEAIPEQEEEEIEKESRTGLYYYTHLDELPYFKDGAQIFMVSSHDLTGANNDSSNHGLYRDGSDYVLLDVMGAGCVSRMFFAEINNAGNLKIFFDDASDPKYDMPIDSYFNDFNPPFKSPLVQHTSGGYVSYVPLCFEKRIKIQTTSYPKYFQIEYYKYASGENVVTHTGNESGYDEVGTLLDNAGLPPISWESETTDSGSITIPANSSDNLTQLAGEGVITGILIDPSITTPDALRNIWLKAYFDQMSEPTVNAPISHLFLSGYGEEEITSLMVGMRTDGYYYIYFPMPYWNGARIEIQNDTDSSVRIGYEVHYVLTGMPRSAGHFYAKYNSTDRIDDEDYTLLDTTGKGHFVGAFMFMRTVDGAEYSRDFLDGDEHIWIDDSRSPVWYGTGTDNYFNAHMKFMLGPFTTPLYGFPYTPDTGANVYAFPAYRLNIGDFVPFEKSITITFEHGASHQVPVNYESVAFYYRHCLSGLVLTDTFQPGDVLSAEDHNFAIEGEVSASAHEEVCGCFEHTDCSGFGPAGGSTIPCTGEYQTFSGRGIKSELQITGRMSFDVSIDSSNTGVRLMRVLDYTVANQNAKVYVDGEFAGFWYTPGRNIYSAWLESSFDIPARLTAGKDKLSISIEYESGQEWNAYEFSVYSYISSEGPSPGPGAPENLRMVRQIGLSVELAWDPPRSGTAPLYYHVYRADQPDIPPGNLTHIARVQTTTFTDDNDGLGLEPQTHYYYKVVAEDCTGVRGPASDELDVETGLPPREVEAEDVVSLDNSVPSNMVSIIEDSNASGGKYVCLQGSETGILTHRVSFFVTFDVAGDYIVSADLLRRPDGGTAQVSVAGALVGSDVDFYAESTQFARDVQIGTRHISTGNKLITFRLTGKNTASTGYYLCIDKFIFK